MIRIMRDMDVDTVAGIWLDANMSAHDFIDSEYWTGNYDMVRSMLPQAEVYVYEDDGGIQGFIGLEGSHVSGIFVRGESRSRRIGKLLLDYAKVTRDELTLDVYQRNVRAVRFYCREGFEIVHAGWDDATREEDFRMIWQRNAGEEGCPRQESNLRHHL